MILLSSQSKTKLFLILTLIVYSLKIIGLAPFSPGIGKSAKKTSSSAPGVFRFSKIGLAYNVLLLILVQIMSAIALPTFFSLTYPHSSPVTQAIDGVQGFLCSLATHAILISWIFHQENGVSIVNRLLEIDRLLSGIEKEPRKEKRIFVFLVLHVILSTFLWIVARGTGAWILTSLIYWSFYTILNFIVYSFIIEYFCVVGFLAKELGRVNSNLLKLKDLPDRIFRTPFLDDYVAVLSFSSKSHMASLKLLLDVRTRLYEISKDVEGFFSFPISLAIGYFFFMLVYNVYYLIYTLLASNRSTSLIPITNSISWILITAYPVTLLSLSVEKAVKEARITGCIIHKLLATGIRQEIKVQLKEFSLQLLHEHLRFTAYGFFSLDCTMLHSILEATAMYNVILIQFSRPDSTPNNT